MDPTREDVPRVSVDTVHDWNRIKHNYSSAALTLLDQAVASGGNPHHKNAILPHLIQFIERTFDIARPNLRVNGRNFEDLDENDQEFEAFDEGLDRRIWSLSEQCLQWDVDIARKRRERPLEVQQLMRDILQEHQEQPANNPTTYNLEEELIHEDSLSSHLEELSRETFALSDELQQIVPIQSQRLAALANVELEVRSLR